jgi:glycosyltransferase involved in cell wall biosynthesis
VPRISVLLPVKDGAATIRSAVRSTLRALPRDAELLVVDDGSSDATGEILAAIDDRRLRVLRHDEPRGVAASLNHALEATDSAIVGRMDADDLSLPWRFRLQLPALADADLVFGSMLLIDARSRPVGFSTPMSIRPATAALHLLFENPFAHPTLVGRREALTGPGGYRATKVEDYDLWLRAVAHGARLRKLSSPVLAYRRHPGQATQSWEIGAADPVLDESYGAALPAQLRPYTSTLRAAAVARVHTGALAEGWPELREHLAQQAAALPEPERRGLLKRLRAISAG